MYTMILQNSETLEIFDISSLVSNIQHYTDLKGQPGKLTFTAEKDPNDILEITCGSIIHFMVDGIGIFFGYVFTMGTDATGIYKITAYDQLRYFKNKDSRIIHDMSASTLFNNICFWTNIKLFAVKAPASYNMDSHIYAETTYFEMLQDAIQKTNLYEKKFYFIRDNFGILEFNELGNTKTDLIIGDKSLLTGYQYELDIDKNTTTRVKIQMPSKEKGNTDIYIEPDISNPEYIKYMDNIAKFGILQEIKVVPVEMNAMQVKQLAQNILKLKSEVKKTMKLNALGVPGLTAGTGFALRLSKLNIFQDFWITSATHNYGADLHTMDLEVFI